MSPAVPSPWWPRTPSRTLPDPGEESPARRPSAALPGVALAAALACLFPAAPAAPASDLALGLLLPPGETDAAAIRRGAQVALERHNATNSVPARLVVRGGPGQWGSDGEQAAAMALDDRVRVLIAPPDGASSHLVLQVAGRTQIPVVTLCPDASVAGGGVPWMVRLVPSTVDQARALLPQARSWSALVPEARPGREAASDLAQAAAQLGVPLRAPVPVDGGDATRLPEGGLLGVPEGATDPDEGILVWLPAPAAAVWVRRLRLAGHRGPLAGPMALRSEGFVRASGEAARGFLVPDPTLGGEAASLAATFSAAFERRWQVPPDFGAVAGGEAVDLALAIVRQAAGRPPRLAFPLPDLGTGPAGPWRFDRAGNRVTALRPIEWTGESWRPATPPGSK